MAKYRIALDAMGGDNAPVAIVEGAKLAVEEFPDITVQLYGPEDALRPLIEGSERIEIVHAPEVIGMHAVSYTHLDVYKRQVDRSSCSWSVVS